MKNYYTKEQIGLAKNVDLVALLRRQGEVLTKSGGDYLWREGSDKVNIRGNLWYHHYENVGGDALDFVMKFFNMNLTDAVAFLLEFGVSNLKYSEEHLENNKKLYIPKANDSMRRIFAYLVNDRCLDKNIVYAFVHRKLIYESAIHHNVVFVGYDKNSNIRHIHMRGSTTNNHFKSSAQGSDLRYCFHWNGTSDTLYLFEAPIDLLSYITLQNDCNWKDHTYVASCSVCDRALLQSLKDNPQIKKVVICFDNDDKGKLAMQKIEGELFKRGITTEFKIPMLKDWNEDLIYKRKRG